MRKIYKDTGIIFAHIETGFSITMEELKSYLAHDENSVLGFNQIAYDNPQNIMRYRYKIKDIPFSKDFYMITKENEIKYESKCDRCGHTNFSNNELFQCEKCNYIYTERIF